MITTQIGRNGIASIMGEYNKICISLMLILALSACGTLRKNDIPILSASDIIVKSYIESEDYSALIESVSIYPEQYHFVTNYLINSDYSTCRYDKLLAFELSSASDTVLSQFYTNLREEYEDDVMENLGTLANFRGIM